MASLKVRPDVVSGLFVCIQTYMCARRHMYTIIKVKGFAWHRKMGRKSEWWHMPERLPSKRQSGHEFGSNPGPYTVSKFKKLNRGRK